MPTTAAMNTASIPNTPRLLATGTGKRKNAVAAAAISTLLSGSQVRRRKKRSFHLVINSVEAREAK